MSFESAVAEVVTDEVFSVRNSLNELLLLIDDQRIGSLDVIVDDTARQDTSLSLRQVECWQLVLHCVSLSVVSGGCGVIYVKD